MATVTFTAPAKINLSLLVHGKRPDGFHEIETLMTPISLADRLTFSTPEAPGLTLTCSDPSLSTGPENLVMRAAEAFFTAAGLPAATAIHLEKAIPHGAGLGGGSSDAATTLLALNRLHQTPLAPEALHELAAGIGSDVPFFLSGSAAICRGRGEQIAPAPFRERLPLLLIKPGFGIPTPWAYSHWAASKALPGAVEAQRFEWGHLVNDLERPVFGKYLFIAVIKQWLLDQPEVAGALMSGSGATCFAVLREPESGPRLLGKARAELGDDCWMHLCRTEPGGGIAPPRHSQPDTTREAPKPLRVFKI